MDTRKALQRLREATEKKDEPALDVNAIRPPGPGSPSAFYHPSQKSFVFCAALAGGGHSWVDLPRERYKAHLAAQGFSSRHAESLICWSEINQRIQYFGPVAGRMPGYYEDNGSKIVVDRGPRLLEPCPGDWSTLRALIEGLFGGDEKWGAEQLTTYHGWVKSSVEALRGGLKQSQQVMVICGPSDCGKSLLQHLMTHFLGGRSAKAHRYFSGATTFNGDMLGAEHLIIEDDYMPSDMKSRLALGAQFKQFAVGTEAVSFNAKFQQAVNLRAFFRISVTTNDEPENLMVLPPLNGDVGDKIILLKAQRFALPMPTSTAEEKAAFWDRLYSEIPHYLWWLINEFQLPETHTDRRYGVATWHHPEVAGQLEDLAPEEALWFLIERHFFENTGSAEPVRDTANNIRTLLLSSGDDFVRRQAEKLIPFAHQMSTYLKRLAKRPGGRVSTARSSTARLWKICPRSEEG